MAKRALDSSCVQPSMLIVSVENLSNGLWDRVSVSVVRDTVGAKPYH